MEAEGEAELAQTRGRHIRKRALKNKSLAISFDEKDLRDYVTGFHKRKKKRRKEAEKHQEEIKRQIRIEVRKKRKEERDLVQFGGVPSADGSADEQNDDHMDEEEMPLTTISGTTMYDDGSVQVTVTTSEVSREEEIYSTDKAQPATTQLFVNDKKNNLPVTKKPMKKVARQRSRPKLRTKRERRKGPAIKRDKRKGSKKR